MDEAVRIDKWLWEVRLFKTRSQAAEACRNGKVSIGGQTVKPSREPKTGDIIIIRSGILTKTIRVIAFPKSRIAAKLVPEYSEDLTPESEYMKLKMQNEISFGARPRGLGRPTKKSRRDIDRLNEW